MIQRTGCFTFRVEVPLERGKPDAWREQVRLMLLELETLVEAHPRTERGDVWDANGVERGWWSFQRVPVSARDLVS